MTHTKYCGGCRKDLPTTQFSKNRKTRDLLQFKCKSCNKTDNHKFRTEINPQHHSIWQKDNSDRVSDIISRWRQADKVGTIYYIKNPNNEYYIGMTKCYLNVRWSEHKIHYRLANKNKRNKLPGLHNSFDKYGVENHQIETIIQFEDISRKELKEWEKVFIKSFKENANILNTIN